MGFISYPRTSGGKWNDNERRKLRELVSKRYGTHHLHPDVSLEPRTIEGRLFKPNALATLSKIPPEQKITPKAVLDIIKTVRSYPGTHPGTKVYYDPVRHISVLVGASGAILGVYRGRINGKLDKQALYEQIKKRKEQASQNKRQAQVPNKKPKDTPPKVVLGNKPKKFLNAKYATDEAFKVVRKQIAGMTNLGLSYRPLAPGEKLTPEEKKGKGYKGYNDPHPYSSTKLVEVVKSDQPQVMIRLHHIGNSKIPDNQKGVWVITKDVYERHNGNIQKLKEMLALNGDITAVSEAFIPAGIEMRRGITQQDEKRGFSGGEVQYEIMDKNLLFNTEEIEFKKIDTES